MKEQLLSRAAKLWKDFRGFPVGQQAVIAIACAALLIGGVIYMNWAPATTYAPLYTNLAPTDASAIIDKLNANKVPYKLSAAGTEIDVPQSQVYSTRLTVSAAGLPSSGQTGYALLDKEGITTSDFKQQVDYQRAVEGELARTIQSIQGVQAASVHLAIPQQNVFVDSSQKATAAVLLTLAPGTQMSTQQVQSVVYLVSSSVPNMDAKDVTVADSQGNVLSAPGSGVTDATASSTQAQATQAYNTRVAADVQAMIDKALGAGHAVVTVNSVLDFNSTKTNTQTYTFDPKSPPLSQSTTNESYTGTGGSGGTLGAGTAAGSTVPNGAGKYNKTSSVRDNALGTKTTVTENAPGQLQSLHVAVLLDSRAKGVNIAKVSQLVSSYAGITASRGDTLAVQAMPFDNSQALTDAKTSAAAAKAAAAAKSHEQLMSMIKQGAIAGVVLLVLFIAWLGSRRRKAAPPAPALEEDIAPPPLPTPAPIVPDVERTTLLAEVEEAAARRRAFVALAEDQPDEVARVLSGWLN